MIKLGTRLSKEQVQSIINLIALSKTQDLELLQFLCSSVEEVLDSKGDNLNDLSTISTLWQDEHRAQTLVQQIKDLETDDVIIPESLELTLTKLFHEAQFLINNSYDEQLISPTLRNFVTQLSTTTDSYEQKIKAAQTKFDLSSKENIQQEASSPNKSKSQKLVDLLQKALNDPYDNHQLTSSQVNIIKDALGENNFNFLVARYKLSEHNFSLDDLRMLIVGVLPNTNQEWIDNDFVKNLFICCNIAQELNQKNPEKTAEQMQTLREHINIDSAVWKRISQTPHDGIITQGLNFLKTRFSKTWQFIIPTRFKANSAFKQDLDTALSISRITDWQNKSTELQKFASNEFLFHKLSYANLQDGTVIPILESNGTRNFYQVKNLIDKPGIHGFALIPIDTQKSLDLKVVFKSSSSLAKQIIDTENFIPQQEFKQHKHEVLQELNKVVTAFKKKLPTDERHSVSLNIGGHGSGAVLAQHLTNELITIKASVVYKKNQELVAQALEENIQQQFEHELACGKKISNQEAYINDITQHAQKSILKTSGEQYDNLIEINNFHLSTINAGGVSEKTRNNFIQALAILKQSDPAISIECNKIMASGDPLQQTGATDLAAYMPSELMPTNLININAIKAGSYKTNLRQIAKSAALLVAQAVLVAKGVTVPILAPLIILINPKKESKNIIDNANLLIENAQRAHKDCHFNQPLHEYEIISNTTNQRQLNKELTTKIPVFDSKAYKNIKKLIYQAYKIANKTLTQAENYASSTAGLKSVLDDPRGAIKFLTPILTTISKTSEDKTKSSSLQDKMDRPQTPTIPNHD